MDFWGWMGVVVQDYGYLGAFLISIVGNFTVFLPVPYALTIYAFGATLNPLLLGVICGLGSTVGEFSAYLVGWGGRRVVESRYGQRLESAKLLVQRYGMLVIFLFCALPLPTDLILVPLGMLKYDLKKAMVAAFLGKTVMLVTVAYAGRYSFAFVQDLFEAGGLWVGVVTVVLLAVILLAMIRIDWTKFIKVPPSEEETG
jgi:uncharacterized membrane protein YdjX (TVP38/TMEM64 family)